MLLVFFGYCTVLTADEMLMNWWWSIRLNNINVIVSEGYWYLEKKRFHIERPHILMTSIDVYPSGLSLPLSHCSEFWGEQAGVVRERRRASALSSVGTPSENVTCFIDLRRRPCSRSPSPVRRTRLTRSSSSASSSSMRDCRGTSQDFRFFF